MDLHSGNMGIYDRDYYRQPSKSSIGHLQMLSVTTWLIVINVAVYVIDHAMAAAGFVYTQQLAPMVVIRETPLTGLGEFSLLLAIKKMEVWRFITFQFLHANPMHLLFNMIALYFFGPLVESYFGRRRRFLAFYLLCGIGGPIAYFILWMLHVLIAYSWTPLVGASAGIFGILVAAAQIAPDTQVLIWGIVPIKMRTFAWILLGIALYTVLAYGSTGQNNAGGQAAHLGGAAVGFLLISFPRLLRFADWDLRFRRRPPF